MIKIQSAKDWIDGAIGFFDLPDKEYFKAKGLSQSTLKYGVTNPQHIRQSQRCPMRATESMQVGTLVHTLLLQPGLYKDGVSHVCKPKTYVDDKGAVKIWNGNATVCKQWEMDNQNVPVLSENDQRKIEDMAASFCYDEFGSILQKSGNKEIACFAIHEETGLLIKGKLDIIAETETGIVIADIKTTQDGSEREFSKKSAELRYDFQVSAYKWLVKQLTGCDNIQFLHSTIDTSAPHLVRHYELDDVAQIKGMADFERALRKYKMAQETNSWTTISKLSLPAYHYTD